MPRAPHLIQLFFLLHDKVLMRNFVNFSIKRFIVWTVSAIFPVRLRFERRISDHKSTVVKVIKFFPHSSFYWDSGQVKPRKRDARVAQLNSFRLAQRFRLARKPRRCFWGFWSLPGADNPTHWWKAFLMSLTRHKILLRSEAQPREKLSTSTDEDISRNYCSTVDVWANCFKAAFPKMFFFHFTGNSHSLFSPNKGRLSAPKSSTSNRNQSSATQRSVFGSRVGDKLVYFNVVNSCWSTKTPHCRLKIFIKVSFSEQFIGRHRRVFDADSLRLCVFRVGVLICAQWERVTWSFFFLLPIREECLRSAFMPTTSHINSIESTRWSSVMR